VRSSGNTISFTVARTCAASDWCSGTGAAWTVADVWIGRFTKSAPLVPVRGADSANHARTTSTRSPIIAHAQSPLQPLQEARVVPEELVEVIARHAASESCPHSRSSAGTERFGGHEPADVADRRHDFRDELEARTT
jgi:hypothetical protein